MDKDMIELSKVEDRMDGLEKSSGGEGEIEATEEEEEVMLPGFRFHPTDEELVGFYLRRKVEKKTLSIEIIKQIDIYKYDPWDLPKVSTVGEKEWYFFCLRGRKYRNSIRPNRVTGSGFWKATGIDRPIHSTVDANECIGLKKSLVYYRGSAGKGTKTDWMMHEFRLPSSTKSDNTHPSTIQEAENWTICRILKRSVTYKKCSQVWRGTAYKHIPDSSSKTSSYESEPGDEYKYFAASTIDQDERMATGYNFGSQWIPVAQAQTSTIPQIQNQSMSGMYREGNWNEFAKMTENVIDPAFAYECSRYL